MALSLAVLHECLSDCLNLAMTRIKPGPHRAGPKSFQRGKIASAADVLSRRASWCRLCNLMIKKNRKSDNYDVVLFRNS
jgi:hypothetical protein